jgi:hypothetical protein
MALGKMQSLVAFKYIHKTIQKKGNKFLLEKVHPFELA